MSFQFWVADSQSFMTLPREEAYPIHMQQPAALLAIAIHLNTQQDKNCQHTSADGRSSFNWAP